MLSSKAVARPNCPAGSRAAPSAPARAGRPASLWPPAPALRSRRCGAAPAPRGGARDGDGGSPPGSPRDIATRSASGRSTNLHSQTATKSPAAAGGAVHATRQQPLTPPQRSRSPEPTRASSAGVGAVNSPALDAKQVWRRKPAGGAQRGGKAPKDEVTGSSSSSAVALGVLGLTSLLVDKQAAATASALGVATLSSFVDVVLKGRMSDAAALAAAAVAAHNEQAAAVREAAAMSQAVADAEKRVEMLQARVDRLAVTAAGYEHACRNSATALRRAEKENAALRLRLEKQKRSPGSLDLEEDPVVERQINLLMRDELVDGLLRERESLLRQFGQMEALLAATERRRGAPASEATSAHA